MAKRVSISLDKEQINLLNSLKGFGTKEAEKVKNIMLAYLSEKGYLNELNRSNKTPAKAKQQSKTNKVKQKRG